MSPRITIDLALAVPAYRQISDSLRCLLVEGAFEAGSKLPPVRQLAIDLGVHFNTVAQAYRQLADEGWLEGRQGRTFIVAGRRDSPPGPAANPSQLRRRLRELSAEWRSRGLSASRIARELRLLAAALEE
ncbi:MAG: GntR family transcriptional regulator [Bryobacteraceae bacterium]